jgi:hypothetical protein
MFSVNSMALILPGIIAGVELLIEVVTRGDDDDDNDDDDNIDDATVADATDDNIMLYSLLYA